MKNTSMNFKSHSYYEYCSICGSFSHFKREKQAIRETYECSVCKSSLREREHAKVILKVFGVKDISSIKDLAMNENFNKLRIYEPGLVGSMRAYLKALPKYFQSDYYSDISGQTAEIPHQDLQSLKYNDRIFDLVITSDIFEHIRDPFKGFREVNRVLDNGGYHIFTIPAQGKMPDKTIARVDISDDEDTFLLEPRYHGDGKGGKSLVYNDFGLDIIQMLKKAHFTARILSSSINGLESQIHTILARKIGNPRLQLGSKYLDNSEKITPQRICNICGGSNFKPAPYGRLSKNNISPVCTKCGSLERHRIFRAIFNAFRTQDFKDYSCLQFSSDPSIALGWFKLVQRSIFNLENSLDIQDIDCPIHSYHAIVCNHILEHVPDYRAAIGELGRILKPNGFLFLSFPNPIARESTEDWGYPREDQHFHYRLFGRDIEKVFVDILPNHNLLAIQDVDPITQSVDMAYVLTESPEWTDRILMTCDHVDLLYAPK